MYVVFCPNCENDVEHNGVVDSGKPMTCKFCQREYILASDEWYDAETNEHYVSCILKEVRDV